MPFMRFLKRALLIRAGVAIAVIGLAAAQVGNPMAGADGRNFSKCLNACNQTDRNCHTRCKTDCAELFPDGGADRNACNKSCNDICDGQRTECRQVCENIKNPPSPEEP